MYTLRGGICPLAVWRAPAHSGADRVSPKSVYIYIYMNTYIYKYIYTNMYIYICIYIYIYI